jgi:hypothetical protein
MLRNMIHYQTVKDALTGIFLSFIWSPLKLAPHCMPQAERYDL